MTPAHTHETIAAIATPPGRGGIGIIRVSGKATVAIAHAILGVLPEPRRAQLADFRDLDGQAIDAGLALFFPAPHSFTGDDVLELHGHGGPVVMDLLLQRVLGLGARAARPGEFSERAFLNGKLDLVQAEAVADLIESASADAARAALRSLEGRFSQRVQEILDALIALRVHIEAALDFPEEEIDFLADTSLQSRCQMLVTKLAVLQADSHQGQLLHDGMTVVLAGRPNAGKSSLLNLLAERDSAIVSPQPGTTRDIVREQIQIDGLPLHVLDTAGLRPATDAVESEGVRRAYAAMAKADRILLLVDDHEESDASRAELLAQLPAGSKITWVYNKIDLSGRPPGKVPSRDSVPGVAISVRDARGLDALRNHLKECIGFQSAGEGIFSARRRHLEAIGNTQLRVQEALLHLETRRGELAADALQAAQRALGEITGQFTSDDLLGKIFSSFCIGK